MDNHGTVEGTANVRNGVIRMIFVVLSIAVEVIVLAVIFLKFARYSGRITIILRILAALLVLVIYGQHKTASIKMPWIILIMALPVLGTMLYVLIGIDISTHKMRERYKAVDRDLLPMLGEDKEAEQALSEADPTGANLSYYLKKYAGYPLFKGTRVEYYSDASEGLEAQLRDLALAKNFIFMEYHAIEDAESFHRIEEVLVQKVKEGVEVRLFYDDIGSIGFINTDFVRRMEDLGIACRVFNPVSPGLNIFLNNRDHRKITVIDGVVGFTGGYNIANEYFNLTHPFGHWKDTGIRLEGPAVRSLGVTFLEMWNAVDEDDQDDVSFSRYLPVPPPAEGAEGFVQPYADQPIDKEQVGENVYMSIAEGARNYAWFITPYLIITEEMIRVLGLAAKRGVDVRIITPGIPDKKLIYSVTRSYYNSLVRNGVRIFEYTPGFCHCKMCVSDDRVATCGTINLDYRSLYHHFENGCVMYQSGVVTEIRDDLSEVMAQSTEVTEKYRTGRSSFLRFGQMLLRLAAPLM